MPRLKLLGPLFPGRAVFAELETELDLSAAELRLRCLGAGPGQADGSVGQRQETTTGLQFSLSVPEDAPASRPAAVPPVSWELVVRDERSAFESAFPVVVSPKPLP